jgi:hypothetical protein
MSSFSVGDRVQVVGDSATQFSSAIGVITAEEGLDTGRKLIVRLTDETEAVFSEAELSIPPAVFADMIFDSDVSPAARGVRGAIRSTTRRHMRFVCPEFDVHIKLALSGENRNLFGQITAADSIPSTSLVTLFFDTKPYASTITDPLGEFDLRGVRGENALLEIVLPFRRIMVPLDSVGC